MFISLFDPIYMSLSPYILLLMGTRLQTGISTDRKYIKTSDADLNAILPISRHTIQEYIFFGDGDGGGADHDDRRNHALKKFHVCSQSI